MAVLGVLAALILSLALVDSGYAEVLGRISDETAVPVAQPVQGDKTKGRISYRVICTPESEALEECGQPAVDDVFDAEQPNGGAEVPEKPEIPDSSAERESRSAVVSEHKEIERPVVKEKKKKTAGLKQAGKKTAKKRVEKGAKKSGKRHKR